MTIEGGRGRIILVSRRPDARPPGEPPRPAIVEHPQEPERTRERERVRPRAAAGWTVRRLINGGSLAGIATVAGGLVFQKNFRVLGGDHQVLLAMGFGLFVIGMVVLTLCLIGLAAAGARALIAGQGLAAAILLVFAPAIPLIGLNAVGILGYAFPAFFLIVASGGFALALKR